MANTDSLATLCSKKQPYESWFDLEVLISLLGKGRGLVTYLSRLSFILVLLCNGGAPCVSVCNLCFRWKTPTQTEWHSEVRFTENQSIHGWCHFSVATQSVITSER